MMMGVECQKFKVETKGCDLATFLYRRGLRTMIYMDREV